MPQVTEVEAKISILLCRKSFTMSHCTNEGVKRDYDARFDDDDLLLAKMRKRLVILQQKEGGDTGDLRRKVEVTCFYQKRPASRRERRTNNLRFRVQHFDLALSRRFLDETGFCF